MLKKNAQDLKFELQQFAKKQEEETNKLSEAIGNLRKEVLCLKTEKKSKEEECQNLKRVNNSLKDKLKEMYQDPFNEQGEVEKNLRDLEVEYKILDEKYTTLKREYEKQTEGLKKLETEKLDQASKSYKRYKDMKQILENLLDVKEALIQNLESEKKELEKRLITAEKKVNNSSKGQKQARTSRTNYVPSTQVRRSRNSTNSKFPEIKRWP